MVGDNLMLIFKVFAETVPVSKPAKFLLRHWRCKSVSKAAKQRPQVIALISRQGGSYLAFFGF